MIFLWGNILFAQIPIQDISHINLPVKLNGEWGFAEDKVLLPQQTNTITKTLYLPQYLESRHGPKGVATFVIDLYTTPNKPLSLDFNPLVNPWKLFIDNNLVYESGIIDSKNKIYLASAKRQIANFTPTRHKTRITLWIANSQHRHFGLGISPQIAPYGILESYHSSMTYVNFALISILVATGFYHLGLFLVWRRDQAPLWFGLFLLVFTLRIATTSEKIITLIYPSITWEMLTRIEYISGYLTLPLFIMYISSLYPKQSNKIIQLINIIVGIVFVLFGLFTSTLFFTSSMPITEIIIIESVIFVSWVLYHAFKAKEPNSTFAFITFVIFAGTIIHDVLMFSKVIDSTDDWGPIGFIVYLFAQAQILLQRYANAFHTIQKHENELEYIISKRTGELKDLLSQRELLMRELSHRVKNNLQFIIGLLWTKRVKASDETKAILLSLQSQIQAIATVHETLCEQPNISTVNGNHYLKTIIDALQELYPNITFSCTFGEEGLLSLDDTISLGLVVSEMVSNTVKHVYSTKSGTISIDFEIHNNLAKLSYSDGQTQFQNNDFLKASRKNKSIGWSMITELIHQLKAQILSEGNLFKIQFYTDKTV
ncbi:MAG: 7TM diverse intracellular signaling domain-containing protein [Sulfuricurvum sp.]|uniref:sensor histidine kinase n=1 Tax=Sulfuricurvum sp. TaxID=2025608 RepID=UPI002602AE01|nr:7TM diverse intracellular signaling domain-containing protein [Sulfuricurvum sp.]MDD2829231.1 7TM diverse intracellular signaling domain-containing protein [Sulfuricurvum sp.]MDD4949064.1 7TM diverse intracellular signaling domain-containing protein [Sulfuricurvum sp.]